MTAKYLVLCKDYNGYKNVLFMMGNDDNRVNTDNYKVIAVGIYDRKSKLLITKDKKYNVFSDWSVKEIA